MRIMDFVVVENRHQQPQQHQRQNDVNVKIVQLIKINHLEVLRRLVVVTDQKMIYHLRQNRVPNIQKISVALKIIAVKLFLMKSCRYHLFLNVAHCHRQCQKTVNAVVDHKMRMVVVIMGFVNGQPNSVRTLIVVEAHHHYRRLQSLIKCIIL